ncbi:MAG: HPr family phosphocarrier protein [Lachnospiraceae bacterium]|nr:HPr family phosphocarrier protein [Lachnospiraceae bacterium]MBR5339471.1 HPr family phosphocarrier protein [Lachnospiraceae bacterium]
MKTINALVSKAHEMDARRIALLVQTACGFDSEIRIRCEERKMNAKSLMGVLTLGITGGKEVEISAFGEDEEKAAEGIAAFLQEA